MAGFRATGSGLTAIADGSQPLSATASGPEDVAISPDARQVVVTEKLSDTIDTFAVGWGGTLAAAVTSPSDSPLSFAEVFTPVGQLLVNDPGHIVNSDDSRRSFVCGAQPDSAKIGGARRGLAMAASSPTSSRRSGSAR